jgi:tetratricopeptide (TPR) repeat protein
MADAAAAPAPGSRELARRAGELEGTGRWDEAAHLYSGAFRAALLARDLADATEALRGQARVRNQQGRFDEAEELAELSLEIADRSGLHQSAARALNVLGVVRHGRGDWEGARRIFPRALELALDLGDDELAGLACLNAGVIANSTGNPREARMLYLESVGSFVRSGNSVHAMLAYNNLGLASADLHEWMEAELYFSRGIEIGERLSWVPLLAKLYCNRAEPLIHVGDFERAAASLDRAERTAREVGDRSILVEAARFRGMAARLRGRHEEAEAHLRAGLAAAGGRNLALGRAEVLRELGRLALDGGAPERARPLLERARALFLRLGVAAEAGALAVELERLPAATSPP